MTRGRTINENEDRKVHISDLRKSRAFPNPSLGSTLHHQVTDQVKLIILLVLMEKYKIIFLGLGRTLQWETKNIR